MLNILLTGVGGQGTVLSAKLLAQAAQNKGWHVRTAETIGMAQRGGSVVSHVRMGNNGERVSAPLICQAKANLIIAFEPAEAARVLPYLLEGGTLVSASFGISPVTSALSKKPYETDKIVEGLQAQVDKFVAVDNLLLVNQLKSEKALNIMLLTIALEFANCGISVSDLKAAILDCVKPRFIDMNMKAIDIALDYCAKIARD